MATLIRALIAWSCLTLLGCGDLDGLDDTPTPLATIRVEVTGDLDSVRPPGTEAETPRMRVALVWGDQWQPEPFCFLPADSPEAQAVIDEGCPDNLGFVPERVAANVAVEIGVPSDLELIELPAADVMVGEVTGRIAYGSLVVYDDRDDDGTLELRNHYGEDELPDTIVDTIYGASFVSMTQPDTRVAFREGDFDAAAAFYPRVGCEAPPVGFSILGAGGFSEGAAIAAILRGELPEQDPASCTTEDLERAVVSIPLAPPIEVQEVACLGGESRGETDYHEADREEEPVAADTRISACVGLPSFDGEDLGVEQLVFAGQPGDPCRGVTHFTLFGCSDDPLCDPPEFDYSNPPPAWWPCDVSHPETP